MFWGRPSCNIYHVAIRGRSAEPCCLIYFDTKLRADWFGDGRAQAHCDRLSETNRAASPRVVLVDSDAPVAALRKSAVAFHVSTLSPWLCP
jgi:hypothetical protein